MTKNLGIKRRSQAFEKLFKLSPLSNTATFYMWLISTVKALAEGSSSLNGFVHIKPSNVDVDFSAVRIVAARPSDRVSPEKSGE